MSEEVDIAALGRERAELLGQVEALTEQLARASVDAVAAGAAKFYVARDAGVTRRTLDIWIRDYS